MWPDVSARQEFRLVPVLLCELSLSATYYSTMNPRLFPLRHALLPIAFSTTWYLCTRFYFSDPLLNSYNFANCIAGAGLTMKLIDIATMSEPPRYDGKVACDRPAVFCKTCFQNTISYSLDVRCLHWHSETHCHRPRDSRPDDSHLQFYLSTLFLGLKHLLYFDTAQALLANIGGHGTCEGDTIFRDTLSITRNLVIQFPHPLFVALPITFFAGLSIPNMLAAGHYFVTLLFAPFTWLSISPYRLPASALKKEWPPLFDNPLEAMSVRDFWSCRWHSLPRRIFVTSGGKPGAALGGYFGRLVDLAFGTRVIGKAGSSTDSAQRVGGRIGAVMGVFLASGLLHDLGLWGMGRGMELQSITAYFLLQGVGVIAEDALGLTKARRPRMQPAAKSGGAIGGNGPATRKEEKHNPEEDPSFYLMKLWTVCWVVLPATFMLDAWFRRGVTCTVIVPHSLSPTRALTSVWNKYAFRE